MTVHDDVEVTPDAERKSGPSRLLIGLLAVALVLSGILIGVLVSPNDTISTTPAPDSVEVGFAQDMSVHHNQAIESVGSTFQNAASSGPLVLAIAACMLAGLVSFASPCVVPLVPGYLSYLAGIAGADAPPIGAASTSGAPSKLASRWRAPRLCSLPASPLSSSSPPLRSSGSLAPCASTNRCSNRSAVSSRSSWA